MVGSDFFTDGLKAEALLEKIKNNHNMILEVRNKVRELEGFLDEEDEALTKLKKSLSLARVDLLVIKEELGIKERDSDGG